MSAEAELTVVVDDDPSVRKSLARLIRSAGHEVLAFASARELLEWTPPDRPCCVVLDVRMPGLGGLALQEALAAAGRRLSIVFISRSEAVKPSQVDYLTTYLLIGAVIWAYLGIIFEILTETVAWERWEGTIEYTFMAPLSRPVHLIGMGIFAIGYGVVRASLVFGAVAAIFSLHLAGAAFGTALVVLAIFLFASLIRPFGLIVATYLAFMVSITGSTEMRWIESLIAAAAMTLGCVLLFVYLLNLPFQLWPQPNAPMLLLHQFQDIVQQLWVIFLKVMPGRS